MAGTDSRFDWRQFASTACDLQAPYAPSASDLSQVQRCTSLLAPFKHPADYGLSTELTSSSITQRQPASVSGRPMAPLQRAIAGTRHLADASIQQPASGVPSGFRHTQPIHSSTARLGRSRQGNNIQLPQASLASFDSAVPVRAGSSMTAQVQPRAFSASQAVGRQSAPEPDNVKPLHAAIEAVRADSSRAAQAQADLSPDVSKISFRILTTGGRWNGQRGPCSPLTPIPDSPSTPSHHCRCLIQRLRHGRHKAGQFQMHAAASGDVLLAQHIPKAHAYNLFLQKPESGEQYLGRLCAASGQSRFYLLGSCGHNQSCAPSPHTDPVQMVVSYSRPSQAEQQVLALIPGAAVKHTGARLYEDLGNEHKINEVLDKFTQGFLVPASQSDE